MAALQNLSSLQFRYGMPISSCVSVSSSSSSSKSTYFTLTPPRIKLYSFNHTYYKSTPTTTSSIMSKTATTETATTTITEEEDKKEEDSSKLEADSEKFDWYSEWYPVAPVCDLDKRVPHGKRVIGLDVVVWWDPNNKNWNVFDDCCPHRLAPLSEGRIDQWGRLQCVYHGWCFNGSGQCKLIPQAPSYGPPVHTSKKACVASYPCTVQNDIVWFWPNSDPKYQDILTKKQPPYIAEIDDPSYASSMGTRDIPYGYEVLAENLMDPAHVPYAHYGIMKVPRIDVWVIFTPKADREGGKPLEINVQTLDKSGFSAQQDRGISKFIPPCVFYALPKSTMNQDQSLSSSEKEQEGKQRRFLLIFFCIPVSPGKSRLIWTFPRNFAVWLDRIVPRWVFHIGQNLILDSDAYLLHVEEHKIMEFGPNNWQKACFVPTKSDALVVAFRKWLKKYSGGQVDWKLKFDGSLPPTPPREQLLDRYWSHVVNCTSCSAAYKGLNITETSLQIVSVVLIGLAGVIKQGALTTLQRSALFLAAVICMAAQVAMLSTRIPKGFHKLPFITSNTTTCQLLPSSDSVWLSSHHHHHHRNCNNRITTTSTTAISALSSSVENNIDSTYQYQPEEEEEEEAEAEMKEKFDWYAQWYPVMPVCDLDKKKPHAKRVIGLDVVVWWDKSESEWKVFDDLCPHRLAPLSEGRIDQWGRLQCVYHGWCFNGSGQCKFIPQAPPDGPPIHTSKKACVAVYPSTVQNGIVWFWPNSNPEFKDILHKKKPPFVPELDDPTYSSPLSNRDINYGYETLVENLMDPAHVPYAHYGILKTPAPKVKADREGGRPLNLSVKDMNINGFATKQDWGSGNFFAPCVYYVYSNTPPVPDNADDDGSTSPTPAKKERKVNEFGPINWHKVCFVPTKSDAILSGYRRWLNKYSHGQVDWGSKFNGRILPPMPPREQLLDRYWTHVINCSSCNGAYRGLRISETVLQVIAFGLIGVVGLTKQTILTTIQRTAIFSVAGEGLQEPSTPVSGLMVLAGVGAGRKWGSMGWGG
ncbi:Protochlorophyllide-dependent translocon component 52 chloroplastic [Bienertia sinuspersici]